MNSNIVPENIAEFKSELSHEENKAATYRFIDLLTATSERVPCWRVFSERKGEDGKKEDNFAKNFTDPFDVVVNDLHRFQLDGCGAFIRRANRFSIGMALPPWFTSFPTICFWPVPAH